MLSESANVGRVVDIERIWSYWFVLAHTLETVYQIKSKYV